MMPRSQEQDRIHPLPLWVRWFLLILRFLPGVLGLAILWIIQGAQALIPTVAITALGVLLACLQLFFQLLPPALLLPSNKQKPKNISADLSQTEPYSGPVVPSSVGSQGLSPPLKQPHLVLLEMLLLPLR